MNIPDSTLETVGPSVAQALAEDIGGGDLTASLIDKDLVSGASIVAREQLVVAGQAWVDEVFAQVDPSVVVDWYIGDSQSAEAGDVICKMIGPAQALLSGERTALNFLQTLSATATQTAAYVDAISATKTRILDTRKTIPGLRHAQKYAVTCGGGVNHRIGLFDAILIKENHVKSAGSISEALAIAKAQQQDVLIEVEVESHDELLEALNAGAKRILLDNFSVQELLEAVQSNREFATGPAELEASGDITMRSILEVAETGVDYISVGAITKHVRAINLSMLFRID